MNTAPVTGYTEGLAAGRLRFQYCAACDRAVFYPRVLCPHCGADDALSWRTSSGRGVVYASTVLHKRGADPYNVALVDLDEGFRMMSRIEGTPPEDVVIGSPVRLDVVTGEDGEPLAVFRPLEVRS